MIRKWLRSLLGWEEVGKALTAQRDYLVGLEALVQAQGKEIEALKYQRSQREAKSQKSQLLDWEQQVAEYAANEANFKEPN